MELHVVFGYSAAGTIRHALADRDVSVARFFDDLSYGPINLPDPARRRAWIEAQLGFDNPDISDDEEGFWPKVLDPSAMRVAWVSRRSSADYCNFLEYLWRLGDLPTQIIDVTNAEDKFGQYFRSTGSISASEALDLSSAITDLAENERTACRDIWTRLRADNADLRITDRNLSLQSVPISFFDAALLSMAGHDWRPMQRLAGEFLKTNGVSDLLAVARLYDLIDSGMLEARETGRPHPDVRVIQS